MDKMSVVTTRRSEVYNLLLINHLYTEVRIRFLVQECSLHDFLKLLCSINGSWYVLRNSTVKTYDINEDTGKAGTSVSDMRSRWCHVRIAVATCHFHWLHCRLFCCMKHVNKQKMIASAMASWLKIMMLFSIRRQSCWPHMWVVSCCVTYAQA